MKSIIALWLTCLACALGQAMAAPIYGLNDKHRVPNQYIVVLKQDQLTVSVANDMMTRHRGRMQRTYSHALKGFSVEMSEAELNKLARDPRVEYVEADRILYINATQTPVTWGLDRIDQRSLPLDNSYTYNTTGANVNAYIIDSGVRMSHTLLAPRVTSGYTAINDGRGTDDCNGHGTHVAGIVGSSTYGVAKGVNLYAVRVMDCTGSGRLSGVISGVDWVTSNHIAPAVANMSLGGGASTSLDNAVRNSIASGVTYVVAAGNSNADACAESPARVKQALTVGASTAGDARASYSNVGSCVDVFAPGSSIASTWNSSDTATNTVSGTSMASPHVAGIAALYLADHPSAQPAEVAAAITSAATPGALTSIGTGSPNLLASSLLAPVTACPVGYQPFKGNLTVNGETQYQPGGTYYYTSNAGAHSGILNGAVGTDVDLFLYRWDPASGWRVVSSSTSVSPQERIDFNATSGYFIWAVTAYRGTGAYDFCLQHP